MVAVLVFTTGSKPPTATVSLAQWLLQIEIYFNIEGHGNRYTVLHSWLEFPLFEGFDSVLGQTMLEFLGDFIDLYAPIHSNSCLHHHCALVMQLTRLVCVLGFDPCDYCRWCL